MRRRSFDLRRPARRRWSSKGRWAWLVAAGIGMLLLLVMLSREKGPGSVASSSHQMIDVDDERLQTIHRAENDEADALAGLAASFARAMVIGGEVIVIAGERRTLSLLRNVEEAYHVSLSSLVQTHVAADFSYSHGQLNAKKSYLSGITERLNVTDEMINPSSFTRQLIDQISLAKAFVVISKESNNLQLATELSVQIRYSQALLSCAAARGAPLAKEESERAIRNMALLLYQAQQFHYDTATMMMKMKGQIQSLEEKTKSETEKSTKYGQIAAEELPKGLYCLGIRLTLEWFKNTDLHRELSEGKRTLEKLRDNGLYHYCVFSDNILAASVVVNSTATNSKHPDLIVFHLVTDEVNYAPMRAWFSMNSFRGATVEVQKVEDFKWLNASYVPVLKQLQDSDTQNYYFSGSGDGRTPIKFRNPKYLSMLNHLRFYIPEVFPALQKVVFLDDDVVVQKDLTELFSINLNGNVMGAVETCMETFHRFHRYLNYSHPLIRAHFDPDACGWAFGMNVIDMREWRKRNVTGRYHYWQEHNADHTLWKLGSLPPGLLAFYGLVETLDPKWHVLGLGYTNVDPSAIKNGAVLHYNGNMKPWLKIGMEKYKGLWNKVEILGEFALGGGVWYVK